MYIGNQEINCEIGPRHYLMKFYLWIDWSFRLNGPPTIIHFMAQRRSREMDEIEWTIFEVSSNNVIIPPVHSGVPSSDAAVVADP